MEKLVRYIQELLKGIGLITAPVFLFSMIFSCTDNFDTLITKEVEKSKISEQEFVWKGYRSLPDPRGGAAAAVYNGWLYIHGGIDESGVRNDLWRINLSSLDLDTISAGGEFLGTDIQRAFHTMVAIDEKLYIFGGIDASGNATNTLKACDTTSDTWDTEITTSDTNGPFPPARSAHVSFTWNGYLFVHGGEDNGSAVDSDLYRLEFEGNQANGKHVWKKLVTAEYRAGHGAAVIDDIVYMAGGSNPSDDSYFKNMWTFDLESETTAVITVDDTALERKNISLAALDGGLFTFGGETSAGLIADFLAGTVGGDWYQYTGEPAKRSDYALYVNGSSLFLFGGYNETEGLYYNDIWKITLQE